MRRCFQRALMGLARFVGGMAVLPFLVHAQSARWTSDGPQRWTLRTERADIAYVLKDGSGFWGIDVSMNKPRTICLAATLAEAERRVEKWENR